jgi:hypothetical protein
VLRSIVIVLQETESIRFLPPLFRFKLAGRPEEQKQPRDSTEKIGTALNQGAFTARDNKAGDDGGGGDDDKLRDPVVCSDEINCRTSWHELAGRFPLKQRTSHHRLGRLIGWFRRLYVASQVCGLSLEPSYTVLTTAGMGDRQTGTFIRLQAAKLGDKAHCTLHSPPLDA